MNRPMGILIASISFAVVFSAATGAREYHVSITGDDTADGSLVRPLRTIQAAANRAQPGDVITVHEGTYREQVSPPRGGTSAASRIVYRAAPGERVVIKGSEPITGWTHVGNDTWKVVLPNSFFGDFNPYADVIHGDWFNPRGRKHHTGAVYLDGHWLTEAANLQDVLAPAGETPLWFAQVDDADTTIWAQFKDVDPNKRQVEINVRRTVFYPKKPGVNYITVRGFVMMHAATPWAPPTAEQVGLIGTHWSKGWVIENNRISYSTCVGITLGKYGDQWDNTSQNTAAGYVQTIRRALKAGWSKENIGHHVVRNNRISYCEQAGIVGSLGAVFSEITDNEIHHIHVRRLFSGAEMAGIKIHAAIDCLIARNHIHHTCRGIWLDWMAQGTRVTQNLLHDNNVSEDIFVEVNHGPFLIDHNICLSWLPQQSGQVPNRYSVRNWSEGGAYVHNLFVAGVLFRQELRRQTPWMEQHSTKVAGLREIRGGDDRFYNNIFLYRGLHGYEKAEIQPALGGNVFLAMPRVEQGKETAVVVADFDPKVRLIEKQDGIYLQLRLDPSWAESARTRVVTSELLGTARVPNAPFVRPDGSPYRLLHDYFGQPRNQTHPLPGPFGSTGKAAAEGVHLLKVWPLDIR